MASRNTLDEDTKNYLRIFPIVLVEGAKALKYFLRKCLNDENDFKTFLDEFFFKVIKKLTKESEKSDPIENNRAKRDSSWSMIPTAIERRDKCKYDASSLASILITSHIYADDLQHFKKFEDKFVDTITELRRICNRICHNFEETMSSTEFKSIVDEVKHHVTCLGYGTEGITAWEEKQLIDSENAEYIKDLIYAFSVTSIPEYSSAKPQSGSRHDVFCQERKDLESCQKADSMIESEAANKKESLHGARPKKAIEKEMPSGGNSDLTTSKTPSPKIPSKEFECLYCKKTFKSDIEVELHVAAKEHTDKIPSDSDRNWRYRKPPLTVINGEYRMCERSPPCGRIYCTRANSESELKEWKERFEYHMKKIRQSIRELSSEIDKIAYDYNYDNSILKDNIDGVEFEEHGNVDRQFDATEGIKEQFTCIFKFTLKCTGEKQLKCVYLLHDEHRDNFSFTQPLEEDKPQICPGNKLLEDDYVTCRVSVQFVSFSAGNFYQLVIFDLGQKVYIKRKISVLVGQQADIDVPMNSGSIQLNSLTWKDVIPFEEKPEFQQQLLNEAKPFKPKATDDNLLKEELSENNYTMMMHRLIDIEERERQTIIGQFNLKTRIAVSNNIQIDSLIVAQGGKLFGKINLKKALDFDSLAGILILESVNSVACRFGSNPTMAFEAKIYKDDNGDDRAGEIVYVLFNDNCVSEMNLNDGSEHEAEVMFLIDRIPFVEMHFAVKNLKKMNCVWPKKSEQLMTAMKCSNELDMDQETAASFICSKEMKHEQAFLIICGPFGTGKTRVLATSVKRILARSDDSRVLICTLSNSAADLYIIDGLQEESDSFLEGRDAYKILRVYQPNRRVSTIPQRVKEHCLFENETKVRVPERDDIEKAKVVICTLATAIYLIPLNVNGLFTHILIDEAGQALEPQTIMPITLADKKTCVVLAGDHLQMSPKIYSKSSKAVGFHISLLERLKKMRMANSVLLRRNYRTCRPILEFLSKCIYENGIEYATNEEFSLDFGSAMSLVEVKGLDTKRGSSYVNKDESTELVERVKHLYDHWPEKFGEKDIAVVTSYHAQVFLIRKLLRKQNMKDVLVEHVRNIQGRQFRVIFISTVRTRKTLNLDEEVMAGFFSTHTYGFLSDEKLLNTAFTRAKSMIVVVGDPVALCSAGECCWIWSEYVQQCEDIGGISPKSLTFGKIMTEINCIRQRLDPTAKPFKPSGMSSLTNNIPTEFKHNSTSKNRNNYQIFAEKRSEEKLNDVILRELKKGNIQSENLEENVGMAKGTSQKKKKLNWRKLKLEDCKQIIVKENIEYTFRPEEVALENPIYWLDKCKREPEKYKYCTFSIDHTGTMFAIDTKTGKYISITSARLRGTAFEKDTVVVEVLGNCNIDCTNEANGEVKYVIERHFNPCLEAIVCKLDPHTNMMVPTNKALPKFDILGKEVSTHLKTRFPIYDKESLQRNGSVEVSMRDRPNALFVVKYLKWCTHFIYPLGCVIERLPPGDTLERGLKIILLEHNVDFQRHWREPVKEELNMKIKKGWRISDEEERGRLDLRKECIFTIDPTKASDLDDALSVEEIRNGYYRVGIHIADVSYFVEKDTRIDTEAKKRGTSYYPTSAKHIPMIPKQISSICSLQPNEDRLAISVILTINKEGCLVEEETEIKRSIVKSHKRFSYEEIEKIIQKRSDGPTENMTKQIRLFNELATKRREIRLERGRYCYNHDDVTDDLDCPLAYSLVEEFMLLANEVVGKFLISKYRKCVPIRRQLSPDFDKMQKWIKTFHGPIKNSLEMSAKVKKVKGKKPDDLSDNMTLTKDVWHKLVGLLNKQQNIRPTPRSEDKGFFKIIDLVANDMLHPQLMIMKLKHYNIQCKSEYVCSGRDDTKHYSLSIERYTQFTSPIRRYIDLVVHRLLVAALKGVKQPPYMSEDIEDICNIMNEKALNAERFERRTKDFVLALNLKEHGALPYQPVIDSVDDTNIYLAFPQSYISRCQDPLGFNYLKPFGGVVTDNEISTATWKITLCNAGDQSSLLTSVKENEMSRLDPARYEVEMKSKYWHDLVGAIISGTQQGVNNALRGCIEDIKIQCQSRKDKHLVDTVKYEKFECTFQRFNVMRVHLAPELRNGMLQPTIQLVSLADNVDVCVEHRKNPVMCFSQLATENPLGSKNIEQYKKRWLSVLAMCSAYGAVHEDNAIIIRDVFILWQKNDSGLFTGLFMLQKEFCDSNVLRFFRNSRKKKREEIENDYDEDDNDGDKDDDDDDDNENDDVPPVLDYLCVRYSNLKCEARPEKSKLTHLKEKSTSVWVGHCYTTDVNDIETYLMIELKLHQSAIQLPFSQILKQEALCTVELIPKSPPDRRAEAAVLALGSNVHETSITRCIVLRGNITSNGVTDDELRESLDKNCRNWKIHSIPEYPNVPSLPSPNPSQTNAIEKAIFQTFTVIQGPPGTGKSVTGSQLAFFFAQINVSNQQVLYCGPSNRSVEVVAGYLKRLRGISVVRVYSETIEDKDYPRPWLTKPKRKFSMTGAAVDSRNHDIALHHRIRQRGNKFSSKIQKMESEFNKRIMDNKRTTSRKSTGIQTKGQFPIFTKEELYTYNKLITDAKEVELRMCNVILTTCNVAGASEIKRFCNIIECIIDEAGMCTEPESLIPLVACKPQKVVLIGDHKQLRYTFSLSYVHS